MTKIAATFAHEFATALANADTPTNVAGDNVTESLDRFRQALESVSNQDDHQNRRSKLPADASDWLRDALSRLSGEGTFSKAIVAAAEAENWYQIYNDDTPSKNDETNPMEDLAPGMFAARLIGPSRGLIQSNQMLAGLFLLRPQLHYPLHQHEATEIYFAVSGTAYIQHGINGEAKRLSPGQVSLTPSNRLHALTMGDEPVLLLWTWLGEFGGRNWWWHRQNDGSWRRDAWERSEDASWVQTASEPISEAEITALQSNDN
jgi:quercetin dioxygenase-like cupin family protein